MGMKDKDCLIMVGTALYGDRWQTDLARELGYSDGRRIRQWLSGDRNISQGVRDKLVALLKAKQVVISDTLGTLMLDGDSQLES